MKVSELLDKLKALRPDDGPTAATWGHPAWDFLVLAMERAPDGTVVGGEIVISPQRPAGTLEVIDLLRARVCRELPPLGSGPGYQEAEIAALTCLIEIAKLRLAAVRKEFDL